MTDIDTLKERSHYLNENAPFYYRFIYEHAIEQRNVVILNRIAIALY